MKSVVMIVSLIALSATAQTSEKCNQIQLEKEVSQYIKAKENSGVRFIGNCLAKALKVASATNGAPLTEEQVVLALKAGIDQDRQAAQVKGEIFEKANSSETFSQSELDMLDADADLKRANPLEGVNE